MGFLSFMSGYTIILSPICSIMIVDYYFVKHGKIDIPSLYKVDGRYYYSGGVNWRAALALLCTVPLGLPGLIGTINTSINVGSAGVHLFDISYIMEVRFLALRLDFFVRLWIENPSTYWLSPSVLMLSLQFVVAGVVYYTTSILFPAHDSYVSETEWAGNYDDPVYAKDEELAEMKSG